MKPKLDYLPILPSLRSTLPAGGFLNRTISSGRLTKLKVSVMRTPEVLADEKCRTISSAVRYRMIVVTVDPGRVCGATMPSVFQRTICTFY